MSGPLLGLPAAIQEVIDKANLVDWANKTIQIICGTCTGATPTTIVDIPSASGFILEVSVVGHSNYSGLITGSMNLTIDGGATVSQVVSLAYNAGGQSSGGIPGPIRFEQSLSLTAQNSDSYGLITYFIVLLALD